MKTTCFPLTRGAFFTHQESAAPSVAESLAQAHRTRRDINLKGVEIPDADVRIDFESKLGEGGFGKVYVADYMHRNVSVKVRRQGERISSFLDGANFPE